MKSDTAPTPRRSTTDMATFFRELHENINSSSPRLFSIAICRIFRILCVLDHTQPPSRALWQLCETVVRRFYALLSPFAKILHTRHDRNRSGTDASAREGEWLVNADEWPQDLHLR